MKHYSVNRETQTIVEYVGDAEPGSLESEELCRKAPAGCDIVVEGLCGDDDEAPLRTGTVVKIDSEGVIVETFGEELAGLVLDYDTASLLDGAASDELIEASREAEPTGAVAAYRDADGVWQYVPEADVEFYRRQRREDVKTVYIE